MSRQVSLSLLRRDQTMYKREFANALMIARSVVETTEVEAQPLNHEMIVGGLLVVTDGPLVHSACHQEYSDVCVRRKMIGSSGKQASKAIRMVSN